MSERKQNKNSTQNPHTNPAKMGAKQGHNLTSMGRCSKFLRISERNSSISGNVAGLV